ncbi:MAG: hypothetical protein Q4C88_08930 [Akkermansia sp.]|nr:hypothetical protein [Akkermansia sp.]
MNDHTAILKKWKENDFFAPDTVVLGLDIGIEGIGIAVRKGTELVYCKTLLVDLPEAETLAQRRQFRASRHARKNRRIRMRRLKELFAKHDLPWVADEISHKSDPYKLRHRAVTSKLASKEALSLCIRSCVEHRGYDYFALTGKGSGEYPWGETLKYADAVKWVRSAYIDEKLKEYLLGMTTELQKPNGDEIDAATAAEWMQLVEERHAKAAQEGIEAKLKEYAHTHLNERKYRGLNYPRAHVAQHLVDILQRHKDLIDDYRGFVNALFLPCDSKEAKKHAIFYYNRKTPAEAEAHYEKKVKACPYCALLDISTRPCGLRGDKAIKRWKLVDFLSNRTFDIVHDKTTTRRSTLPAAAVEAMVKAVDEGLIKWIDIRKCMDTALKPAKLQTGTASDWNKLQIGHLKDICAPDASARKGRASLSAEAADGLFNLATQNGTIFAPAEIESWKREWDFYGKRAEIDAVGGIYPQVRTLLGTLRIRQGKSDGTFATTGFLQRIFAEISDSLDGKAVPDYCVIECIKNPATNVKRAAEIQKEQSDNRLRKLKQMEKYNCTSPTNSAFLRMRLFEEQGGSLKTDAICPFTGQSLGRNPFDDDLKLAHLYPDSKGGLYIAENLVLTRSKTNDDMGPRTPREAARAHLDGWLSWEEMQKQALAFKWNEKKRKLFAFQPSAEESFPDFNNMTRTAQLARELRRLVAVWMGISKDPEATRRRIGNPSGSYTAAARRRMLRPECVKDRSNNLHHRLDAAVMTCIPPAEGVNDVCNGGIFYTDTSSGNRILSVIDGLPLPDFPATPDDSSTSPIVKTKNHSKFKSLGDSTFWSVDENNRTHQRIKLDPSKFTAAGLYSTLLRMRIPSNRIPSEKEIQRWLVSCQAATTADENTSFSPLRLKNNLNRRGKGVQVKNIWKFSNKIEGANTGKGKGSIEKSPLGWNGIITKSGKFDQLFKLNATNDRLELWIGWDAEKGRWNYYTRVIPTAEALAGLKRLGIPWRGRKNAPNYLIRLLDEANAFDMKSFTCGTLPPHAVKLCQLRKGDLLIMNFKASASYLNKLKQKDPNFNAEKHPSLLSTWGAISAINTSGQLEIKCVTFKDREKSSIMSAKEIAKQVGLPFEPSELAAKLKLQPPT